MEKPSKLHPLLIEQVLENIFQRSTFTNRDLLALREVCVNWNAMAIKQCTIAMGLGQTKESMISRMKNLIRFLQNPASNFSFVNKFYFSADFFPEHNDAQFHTTFGKLLDFIAGQLEYLSVEVCESNALTFQENCYNKIGNFGRLQTLETKVTQNVHNPKRRNFSFVPHLIGTILERSPALKKLLISWVSNFSIDWPHLGDKVLSKIPKSVERLDIQRMRFGLTDFQKFSSLNLPNLIALSLNLWLSKFTFTGDHVYDLFANHKNETLLELELSIWNIIDHMQNFKLPVFPNVHTLKLGELFRVQTVQPGVDMSFLTLFPKMTHLDTTGGDVEPDIMVALFPAGATASWVKSCSLRLDQYTWFDGFTELTKLTIQAQISLDKLAYLSIAFRQHNRIQDLELELEEALPEEVEFRCLDSMLTGIPAETCESIRTNPAVWRHIQLDTIKIKPGISDLTNLKTLSIKSQIPVNITDVTAKFGFLKLPKLTDLVIEEFNMSQTCIQNLKLKFGAQVIRRPKGSGVGISKYAFHQVGNIAPMRSLEDMEPSGNQATWNLTEIQKESQIERTDMLVLLQSPQCSPPALKMLVLSSEFFPRYRVSDFQVTLGNFLVLIASQLEDLKVEMSENNELTFEGGSYIMIGRFERLRTLEARVRRVCYCLDAKASLLPCSLHEVKRGGFLFLPHLIQTILRRTVILQKLSILWSSSFRLRWPNLVNVLFSIPKSIQCLDMRIRFSVADYEVFGSLHLPNLTSLSLTLFCDFDVPENAIYNLFANSKNETLLDLDLTIQNTHYSRIILGLELPVFPNLRTFKLGTLAGSDNLKPEVKFPTLFPKVTEFILKHESAIYPFTYIYPSAALETQRPQWTAPLVKSFSLHLTWPGSPLVSALSGRFPGLTKLSIHIRDIFFNGGHFGRILSAQRGLEHLELEVVSAAFDPATIPNIDSVLTGVSAQTLQNIQANPEWTGIPISTIKINAGISDLKKLKTLSIKSQMPINITDVTAYLGFLLLPELEKLDIEEFNMSQRCITELKRKFGNGVIQSSLE